MVQRTVWVSTLLCFALFLAVPTVDAQERILSFDDRVRAQEAIERVYYAHQIGATRPFEEVVTRKVLERKVRTYLEQSVALERLWDAGITSEALAREWDRIVRDTRFPERLQEIAAALGWDSLLLHECVARPALANRRVGDYFASDDRLHAGARQEADRIRALLKEGDHEAAASGARVHHVLLKRVDSRSVTSETPYQRSDAADAPSYRTVKLDSGTYRARRGRAPRHIGQVGEVIEGRSAFEIRVLLEEGAAHARVASYFIPKQAREVWWREVRDSFDADTVVPFAELADEDLGLAPGRVRGFSGAFDPSCVPDDMWDNGILEDPNPARDGHTAIWTGTEMIVWGGGELNSGLRYDPLLDVFTPTSRYNAPAPRGFHTAVWTGSEMIVWGGWPLTTSAGRYDPVQDSWTPVHTEGAPSPRFDHTAVWTGFAMVVWGGNEGGDVRLGDGRRYYPDADVWTPMSQASAPLARDRHTAIWSGTEMIVWGGLAPTPLGDGSRYDPILDRWIGVATEDAPAARSDHLAVWTGSQMIVWGGTTPLGSFTNTGGRYDPVLNIWTGTSLLGAPTSANGLVGVWAVDEMLVWGGTDAGSQGRYDPATNSWSGMSSGPDAPPATQATAVWTGDRMIVWSPAAGGRYDPAGDSWSTTDQPPATDGPSDRAGHTAVWTGTQMIVWGGPTSADPLGSRYDPLLETWTAVPLAGSPAPRSGHTAVWTGDEMIVWGGDADGVLQNSGGRYDPVGDSWQSTSAVDAPQARDEHTAVWTGSRMLIWGGFAGGDPSTQPGCEGAYPATGASYDPLANDWTAITPTGAPIGRGLHTAVWSGSEMLVWGGKDRVWDSAGAGTCIEDVAVADGSRYDPALDSWTPIDSSGELEARYGHTAVWADDVMVVWGGSFDSTPLDSGGRYAPATDSWSTTTLDGAPAARGGHTAIWTGHEMVVWGGGSFMNSGGRYQPEWDYWRATSGGGAPAPRDGHSAVWTGDLMIVWGGSEPMGGRYAIGNPDNNGDGIADGCLACPAGPGDDSDGDGVICSEDNCPFDANPTQLDEDGDDWGDVCDPCLDDIVNDADLDLVCHRVDNCATGYNPDQADADGDGDGDVCDDNDDSDSWLDAEDNCRVVANDDQTDSDLDGFGDACDVCIWDPDNDVDDDGVCGNADNCPTVPNVLQSDVDGDFAGDLCDVCPGDPLDNVVGNGLCFAPEVVYDVGARPESVTAADFDGNGFDDLMTANKGTYDGSELTGEGDGGLELTATHNFGNTPTRIRSPDLNQDGLPDLVILNSKWDAFNPVPGAISVVLGEEDGFPFEGRVEYPVGINPASFALADFDVDGNLDLMVTNRNTVDLSYLRGTSFGTFYVEIIYPTFANRRPEKVTAGDFNNDGFPDFALSINNDDKLQTYLNAGDATFIPFAEGEIGTGGRIYSQNVGDFNEDGTLDLAISHASPSYNRITILRGDGTGQFLFVDDIEAGTEGKSLQVGDFNWDGHDDIVVANQPDWDISILTGDGNEGFADEVRLGAGPQAISIAIADLEGDGRQSLAVSNRLANTVSVYRNLGPYGPTAPVADAGPNGIWIIPADSPSGATVTLDGSGSTDVDSTPGTADDIILYEWYKNFAQAGQTYLGVGKTLDLFLPFGSHSITLRTTDTTGLTDTDLVRPTVMSESIIPDLTIVLDPPNLWPPNHRLVEVQATIVPGPTCSNPSALLGSITSTEADNLPSTVDGDTNEDIRDFFVGYPDFTFQIRAERSALTPGRTYYVQYMASCSSGNVKPFLFSFSVPFEIDGTAEPMQIVLDETELGTLVAWAPVSGAAAYDVIRGSLANLTVTEDEFDLGDVVCIEASSPDESTAGFEDPAEPGVGEVFFYLVQFQGEGKSGYGTESAVKPRIPASGDCM